jgi:threonine dehydrogenase-like Zn-dependent dehydrogenase
MIKVRTAAICGSDLHLFKGKHPSVSLPSAVGHELSGEVVRVGRMVTGFEEGDRVTWNGNACGIVIFRGEYHCVQTFFHTARDRSIWNTFIPETELNFLPLYLLKRA